MTVNSSPEWVGLPLESAITIAEEFVKQYQQLQKDGYTHWNKDNMGRLIQAGVNAALAQHIERVKREARLDEARWWAGGEHPWKREGQPYYSEDCGKCQRIAELEKQA